MSMANRGFGCSREPFGMYHLYVYHCMYHCYATLLALAGKLAAQEISGLRVKMRVAVF